MVDGTSWRLVHFLSYLLEEQSFLKNSGLKKKKSLLTLSTRVVSVIFHLLNHPPTAVLQSKVWNLKAF